MKKINLENIIESLEGGKFEITVPEKILAGARRALDRMIEIGK